MPMWTTNGRAERVEEWEEVDETTAFSLFVSSGIWGK